MSINRREFISLVGTSVAGATAVAVGARALGTGSVSDAPLGAADWTIAEVGQVDRGAVPFVLERRGSGERIRIEACRRGSRQQPVAQSRDLDLFLANNGDGVARTAREHELVARALARHIDAQHTPVPATVVSLDDRHARHRELFSTADDLANS
ncbi:MAG: hypothetical protein H6747_07040 [Deltaproteobacteria bacterium]|nr:hypothetical protein [Deltaproteobacteria bacterium]